jgi:glycerol-3-phosphate dehydrogenase (NAD(P)+)
MKNIIHVMSENYGDINESVYLGDLLVTSYSSFSRNRKLGIMIGEGLSVSAAKNKMTMIAEGYYSSKFFKNKITSASIDAPIINLVYKVLHEEKPLKVYLQNFIDQKI